MFSAAKRPRLKQMLPGMLVPSASVRESMLLIGQACPWGGRSVGEAVSQVVQQTPRTAGEVASTAGTRPACMSVSVNSV
jgi:hypothetical protein